MRARGRRVVRAASFGIVLGALACSGDGRTGPDPAPAAAWIPVDTLGSASTLALAADPAGEFLLVVEGNGEGTGYRLFDPATAAPLGPLRPLGGVSDVAISLDGSVGALVGGGLPGTPLLGIVDGGERERAAATGDLVERHPARDVFYVAGSAGIFRVDRAGFARAAVRPDGETTLALGVSADGTLVYAMTATPDRRRVVALDGETMATVSEIESPVEVQAFVPLDGRSGVLALGTPADRPFRGPILATLLDGRTGGASTPRAVADGIREVRFSATSPWARVGPASILVPSSYGPIEVDPSSGVARLLRPHVFEGLEPCCAIAVDPGTGRLFATESSGSSAGGGRVVVYERAAP